MARIRVTDSLAEEGISLLQQRGHTVVDAGAPCEAWIIRSGTTISAEAIAACPGLRAIGRAGVGVDNVDLAAATQAGVAVFHAPTGNITSAAEQAWALLLAAARRVPEADASMKAGRWDRKSLQGVELAGKTLFIVGLGRIGRMMAARAQAFEMETLGYDPYVTPETAEAFGVRMVSVEDGFAQADAVTLHTPLTPQTRGMVDARVLARCKPGLLLVNAARGGLVDESALLAALDEGRVARAGIDVWEQEPPTDTRLAKHPRVVAAPHLGASTREAQVKAAVQAVTRVCDFLESGDAGLAVNVQATVPDSLRPWADLASRMAAFAAQTVEGPVQEVHVATAGGIDAAVLEVPALCGALQAVVGDAVNGINAPLLARERGWTVGHATIAEAEPFLRITVRTSKGDRRVEGTFTPHYGARVTMFDGFDVEFRPAGRFLTTRHQDVPGVLARITAALAAAHVNVASVSLARRAPEGQAIAVIQVDGTIPLAARDALREIDAIDEAHRVRVDG